MAERSVSIGSQEDLFLYDDTDTYSDGVSHVGMRARQLFIEIAPSANENVLRLQDVGPGGAVAPADATYLVISLTGDLSAERQIVISTGLAFVDAGANGNYTISVDFKDEDTLNSNSAVHAVTQQSIKSYVDTLHWQRMVCSKTISTPPV